MLDDIHYMKLALELAHKAYENGDVPVGAAVVRKSDGLVAGTGYNTREKQHTAIGHAEISAVSAACETLGGWRLSGCVLYVTLEPCPMCAGAVINSRLDKVVFGAYDKKAGSCGSVSDMFSMGYNHRPTVCGGVMEEECSALLKDFFNGRRENKGRVSFSDIITPDQIRRASELADITESEITGDINNGYKCRFIRRKGKPVGYVSFRDSSAVSRLIISEQYRDMGFEADALALIKEG